MAEKKPLSKIAKGIEKRGTKGALKREDPTPDDGKLTASDLSKLEERARGMPKGAERTRLFKRINLARTFLKHRK